MFVVLCNPTAGSGRAASVLEDVCALLKKRAIAYRIEKTSLPGHATELARKAALSGCHAIVGIGGDGTLSEIIAGLTQRATALYFVPCGTGNDSIRMFGEDKEHFFDLHKLGENVLIFSAFCLGRKNREE